MYSMSSFDIKIHATRIHISRRFICHISFPSVLFLGLSQTTPYVDHCYLNITGLVPNATFSVLCHDGNSFRSLLKKSGMIWPGIFNVFIECGIICYYFEKILKCKPFANSGWQLSSFRVILCCVTNPNPETQAIVTSYFDIFDQILWPKWSMSVLKGRGVFWALPS